MIQINLLPWRQQARKIQKARFISVLIAGISLSIIILIILHIRIKSEVNEQASINTMLQNALTQEQNDVSAVSDQAQQRKNIEVELHTIIDLYNKSYSAVILLNDLAKNIPAGITLNKVFKVDKNVSFAGSAPSESDVSTFMQNMASLPHFNQPVLSEITTDKTESQTKKNFRIDVVLK